ncbi:MAG: acetyl ornithine aminotransferase family protein [Dehalococcoidia bacterium]|nr:acetyl ornithine aminotransferase family protein [Dehalococcoidia bacterium]
MIKTSKPIIVVTPPGPNAQKIITRDHALLSSSLSRTAPLVGVETQGVWVKDIDDNVYLDFGSGIAVANVGHRHPEVTKAIIEQAQKCDHVNSCDYYTIPQVEFADSLTKVMPWKPSKRFFFGNSGTEAVECAIKLARRHSHRLNFLGYIRSFHGRTIGSLAFTSTSTKARKHFGPLMPGVTLVPYPYCYRCPFGLTYPDCGLHCLSYIEEHILNYVVSPDEVAGILLEPLLGAGGYVAPPEEYWPKIRELCDRHDILFIDDEVQTGFARTGKMWACEHWNIEPDIMCMSKAVAAGLPMGVCAAKGEVMDWEEGAHENTLGGNPIIISAAKAVLNIITRDRLWENAERMGYYLLKRLLEFQNKYDIIGDVRGKGLMIGVELVKNRRTKDAAIEERDALILNAFKKGLLLLGAGPCSIRLAPPLILTSEQADVGLELFEESLKEISK